MPDSPARNNFEALRKLSHDPGTERMATKEELVALLERDAETPLLAPEAALAQITAAPMQIAPAQIVAAAPIAAAIANTASRIAAPVQTMKATTIAKIVMQEPMQEKEEKEQREEMSPARAVPIPNAVDYDPGTQLDLVELAAVLDQHRVWVESGGDEGTK